MSLIENAASNGDCRTSSVSLHFGSSSNGTPSETSSAETVRSPSKTSSTVSSARSHIERNSSEDGSPTEPSDPRLSENGSLPSAPLSLSNGHSGSSGVRTSDEEVLTDDGLSELELIKKQIRSLEESLATERGCVIELRKRMTRQSAEKLEETQEFNEEMTLMKCEYATLEAKLEEQVAHNEQLEFEITKARKQLKTDQVHSKQREHQDEKTINDLRERLKQYQTEVASLEETLTSTKRSSAAERHTLQLDLSEQQGLVSQYLSDIEIHKADQVRLKEFISSQESSLKELYEKTEALETDLSNTKTQLDEAQVQVKDLSDSNAEKGSLLQKLEENHSKLQQAYGEISESASESKDSSEELERRNVELEYLLSEERQKAESLREQVEITSYNIQDLEDRHSTTKSDLTQAEITLRQRETELEMVSEQLNTERGQKLELDQCLRQQIDTLQHNVSELKQELILYKRDQEIIEMTSNKIVEELQAVLKCFPGSEHLDPNTAATPRAMVEKLHQTVAIYKSRCTSLSEERDKAKALSDSLNKESQSYKESLWQKEKALKETEKKLSSVKRELTKLKSDSSDTEAKAATLTVDLETNRAQNSALQQQCQKLGAEITQLKQTLREDSRDRLSTLRRIYRGLISSAPSPNDDLERLDWPELVSIISERTIQLHNEVGELHNRVRNQDQLIEETEASLSEMRIEHNERLNEVQASLNSNLERSANQWRSEKSRLEEHFNQMLSENGNRTQIYKEQMEKSQKSADQAWNQYHETDERIHQLEAERQGLASQFEQATNQNRSLLCAFTLLSGMYFPLLVRYKQLISQRQILTQQYNRFDLLKEKVASLLATLLSENDNSSESQHLKTCLPLMKFRRATIVIMAMNRLKAFSKLHVKSFTVPDSERHMSHVCWLGQDLTGDSVDLPSLESWIQQTDLLSVASISTDDIISTINNHRSGISSTVNLKALLRSSIVKMARQLSSFYSRRLQTVASSEMPAGQTCRLLHYGLQTYIASAGQRHAAPAIPLSSRDVVTRLQEKVLSFVNLIHSSETDRLTLKKKVKSLQSANERLRNAEGRVQELTDSQSDLRHEMELMVKKDKVDQVLSELDLALDRERQAQALLSDQNKQLKELSVRLQAEMEGRSLNENSVKNAIKALHQELDKKTEEINKMGTRTTLLEKEKTTLLTKLHDAENALKSAAGDRNALNDYVDNVNQTLQQCRLSVRGSNASLVRLLAPDDYTIGSASSVLRDVQGLIRHMASALDLSSREAESLKDQVSSYESQISQLKRELQRVCTGEQMQGEAVRQRYEAPNPRAFHNYPIREDSNKRSSNRNSDIYQSQLNYDTTPYAHREYENELPPFRTKSRVEEFKLTSLSPRVSDQRATISPRDNMRNLRQSMKHSRILRSAGNERSPL